jgi:hypothetical protein
MSAMVIRTTLLAALVMGALFAAGAPAAPAQTPVSPGGPLLPGFDGVPISGALPAGPAGENCGNSQGQFGTGATAGTTACAGPGLTFVGPAIGQVAVVIGPTIIGPAQVGSTIVSAGGVGGTPVLP